MTTTSALLGLAATALKGQTDAGQAVYTPGDYPTWSGEYPVLLVQATAEEKQSWGRAGLGFTVTATLRIVGRVSAPAAAGDGGAVAAEAALWRLSQQVEVALINNPALMGLLQQVPFVRTRIGLSQDGETHIAELVKEVGLEFAQEIEDFFPIPATPIAQVNIAFQGAPAAQVLVTVPQS